MPPFYAEHDDISGGFGFHFMLLDLATEGLIDDPLDPGMARRGRDLEGPAGGDGEPQPAESAAPVEAMKKQQKVFRDKGVLFVS